MEPHPAPAPAAAPKKRSPWVYVGIGCGALLLLVFIGIGVAVWFGYSTAKSAAEGMTDPVVREQRTKEMLGVDRVPDGFYAAGAISVPMVMDMVFLSDQPISGTGKVELGEGIFMYMRMKVGDAKSESGERRAYYAGTSDELPEMSTSSFQLESGEVLHRGIHAVKGNEVWYSIQRGTIRTKDRTFEDAILTLMEFQCPGSSKPRIGIWLSKPPAPDAVPQEAERKDALADEGSLKAFLDQLDVCKAS